MNIATDKIPKRSPKIAFVFTSSRDEVIRRLAIGQGADTALRGFNHLTGADCFTIPSGSIKAFLFLPRLLRYDFIIAQDNLLLGYIVSICASVFKLRTKWLYTAINSSTLIKRHTNHLLRLFILKTFWLSYSKIICISLEQVNDFLSLGIPKSNLIFVPFGVDVDFFQPTDKSKEEDLIVSVGRDAGRDYQTLFRTAELIPYRFVVVASRKNISPKDPIPSNVSVLYDKSLIEIRDLYRRAKIVVIVSKDSILPEGSDCSGQTVILDALASSKIVIATRRSWITDYFVPDKDIKIVEPRDPNSLARTINTLWNDSKERERLSISGHQKVVTQYSTKVFAESLKKIMDSLI